MFKVHVATRIIFDPKKNRKVVLCVQITMFGSSLPPVVCRRAHFLFTLFVFVYV